MAMICWKLQNHMATRDCWICSTQERVWHKFRTASEMSGQTSHPGCFTTKATAPSIRWIGWWIPQRIWMSHRKKKSLILPEFKPQFLSSSTYIIAKVVTQSSCLCTCNTFIWPMAEALSTPLSLGEANWIHSSCNKNLLWSFNVSDASKQSLYCITNKLSGFICSLRLFCIFTKLLISP
jgi:hypothetical protein